MNNWRLVFCVFVIIVTLNGCKNDNVYNVISDDCKNKFSLKVYSKFLENNFKNPSDSSSICFSELNNFDTLKTIYTKRNFKSIWFSKNVDLKIIDSILKFFNNSYTHG